MKSLKEILQEDRQKATQKQNNRIVKIWAKDAYGLIEDAKMKIVYMKKHIDDKGIIKVLDEADDNINSLLTILGEFEYLESE